MYVNWSDLCFQRFFSFTPFPQLGKSHTLTRILPRIGKRLLNNPTFPDISTTFHILLNSGTQSRVTSMSSIFCHSQFLAMATTLSGYCPTWELKTIAHFNFAAHSHYVAYPCPPRYQGWNNLNIFNLFISFVPSFWKATSLPGYYPALNWNLLTDSTCLVNRTSVLQHKHLQKDWEK